MAGNQDNFPRLMVYAGVLRVDRWITDYTEMMLWSVLSQYRLLSALRWSVIWLWWVVLKTLFASPFKTCQKFYIAAIRFFWLTDAYKGRIIYPRRWYNLKQRDLIKKLEEAGFVFKEHGGNHDTYKRGDDTEQIPRHKEINEITARKILKKWGLKWAPAFGI